MHGAPIASLKLVGDIFYNPILTYREAETEGYISDGVHTAVDRDMTKIDQVAHDW